MKESFWLLNMPSSAYLGEVLQLLKGVLDSSLSQMGTAQQRSPENSLLWSQPLQLGERSAARLGQFSSLCVARNGSSPRRMRYNRFEQVPEKSVKPRELLLTGSWNQKRNYYSCFNVGVMCLRFFVLVKRRQQHSAPLLVWRSGTSGGQREAIALMPIKSIWYAEF